MPATPPLALVVSIVRVVLLIVGVGVMTIAFVGLVDSKLVLIRVEPWWYLGLVGLAAVLLALGSPRKGRVPAG